MFFQGIISWMGASLFNGGGVAFQLGGGGSFLKLVFAIFYQIFIFSPNDNTLKTMKNVFYFI